MMILLSKTKNEAQGQEVFRNVTVVDRGHGTELLDVPVSGKPISHVTAIGELPIRDVGFGVFPI